MSHRVPRFALAIFALIVAGSACTTQAPAASTSMATQPSPTTNAPATDPPTQAPTIGSAPATPAQGATSTPEPPATAPPSPTASGAEPSGTPVGGGGATLPDGDWTAGDVHLVLSGLVSEEYDAPLYPENSSTGHDLTNLTYLLDDPDSARPLVTITLDITPDDVGVVVGTEEFYGNGNPGSAEPGSTEDPCTAVFTRIEADAVEGTITCTDAAVLIHQTNEGAYGLDMDATFTASR